MKKSITKLMLGFIMAILMISLLNNVHASDVDFSKISKEDLEQYLKGTKDIDKSEVIEMYDELTEQYSNKDIANMVQENKKEIINKTGIDEETLNKGTSVLSTLDTEETKKILREDLNIEEIQEKLDNGYTVSQIIDDIQEQMSTAKKVSIATRLLLASSVVKTILIVLVVLALYKLIIRWIVFRKADEHGWASIIPIYNEITYLNVCGINPWWILILIIPLIGWLIYGIVKIISRFTLAEAFNRGTGFGIGLLFLGIIFESIIAFNKNIKFLEYEE